MIGLTNRKTIASLALISMLLLAACGPEAPPPMPTRTPAPTFTPTPEGQVVSEPVAADPNTQPDSVPAPVEGDGAVVEPPAGEGSDEETANATEPPQEEPASEPTTPPAAEAVINSNMNVRGGPGTNYGIVGGANQGERYPVTGRNDDGSWWQIDYNGVTGWVFGDLVTTANVDTVTVAQNIPAPPPTAVPPAATPVPPPPAEPEAPAPAPAPPSDNFPFLLLDTTNCDPNQGQTYFKGFVRDSNNNLLNAVCVHINFYEPRTTKCSGCDGVGDGNWGFSPFGGPAPPGTPVEIYVVPCPPNLPPGGQSSDFDDLTPQSPKWTRVINESEQCTGITFVRK